MSEPEKDLLDAIAALVGKSQDSSGGNGDMGEPGDDGQSPEEKEAFLDRLVACERAVNEK